MIYNKTTISILYKCVNKEYVNYIYMGMIKRD